MAEIEYKGYGYDLADLVSYLIRLGEERTANNIRALLENTDADISFDAIEYVILPHNTGDFGGLVIILDNFPVGNEPEAQFSIAEANERLFNATCRFVEMGFVEFTDQYDIEVIYGARGIIDDIAGYSWENGPWTDNI